MAISKQMGDREYQKFIESTSVVNQTAVAVVNPDGSDLATDTTLTDGTQKTQIVDAEGNLADVIAVNGIKGLATLSPSHISTVNSTSTPLGIGGVWNGTGEIVTDYGVIQVIISSSHTSATNGFIIEFSVDGTNWDVGDTYTVGAGSVKIYSFQPSAQYYRLTYTNGGTAQTYFRLQTVLKPYYIKASSHRVDDIISGQDDAELVKAVLTAKKPNGDFAPITATAGGNLKISIQELSDGTDVGNGIVESETLRVTIASDSTGQITLTRPATAAVTSVGDTVTSTTIIAANTSRREVEFFNGSSAILYLLKGTGTASATNYTVQLNQGDYYSSDITSAFTGMWASDAGGSVLVTDNT